MAKVTTVVVPKPEFDALVAEVEKLREYQEGLVEDLERSDAENERLRAKRDALLVLALLGQLPQPLVLALVDQATEEKA